MPAGEDERQPLLPPAALASDSELHARPHAQDEESPIAADAAGSSDSSDVVEIKTERTWWDVAWRVALTGLAVFFTVLFVKGFIDAKDVNVSVG